MSEPIRTDFLTYGECVCGWSMATHAGGQWPECPICGKRVMPARPRGDLPRYGYVAELYPEPEAYGNPRCDVSSANYSRTGDEGKAIPLSPGPNAWHLYERADLEADLQARTETFEREIGDMIRRRELRPDSWRCLPWHRRIRPSSLVALVVGWLAERRVLTPEQFALLCQKKLPPPTRRDKVADWIVRRVRRGRTVSG